MKKRLLKILLFIIIVGIFSLLMDKFLDILFTHPMYLGI